MEIGKYKVVNLMSVHRQDDEVVSRCMVISFRNQGQSVVHIYPETSGGAVLKLKPNQERTYGTYNPEMEYVNRFKIEFQGSTTNELLIEQEQVELKTSCDL